MAAIKDLYETIQKVLFLSNYDLAGYLAGVASNEFILLVGLPGTGKTLMADLTAKWMGGKYKYIMLSHFTEPDEMLGPVSLPGYEAGKFKRIVMNSVADPENRVVIFDEVFRASSAVRNVLLDIVLNKRFKNWDEEITFKRARFIGATNFISEDIEEQAFLDRMVVKIFFGRQDTTGLEDEEYIERVLLAGAKSLKRITIKRPSTLITELYKLEREISDEAVDLLISHHGSIATRIYEVERIFNKKLSNRNRIKLVKVGVALRRIVEEIVGGYTATDPIRDMIYGGAVYLCPTNEVDLFGGEEMTRFYKLTGGYAVDYSKISLANIEKLVRIIENIVTFKGASTVRSFIASGFSVELMKKRLEGIKKAILKKYGTISEKDRERLDRLIEDIVYNIITRGDWKTPLLELTMFARGPARWK